MKKLLFILVFIPLVSFGQSYDHSISIKSISLKDSLDIMKVMKFQENAWNNGDINSFMEGYIKSDELVFSGKSGPVYGWNETKNRYLKNYPDTQTMGQLKFTVNKIRSVSSDVAFLINMVLNILNKIPKQKAVIQFISLTLIIQLPPSHLNQV